MGYQLYIEARIKERASGKVVSLHNKKDPCDEWLTIGWTCGRDAYPMTEALVEVINRYSDRQYDLEQDHEIYFPQKALREMCSCILSHACFPESGRYTRSPEHFWYEKNRGGKNNITYIEKTEDDFVDWDDMQGQEMNSLTMGNSLLELIWFLEKVHYENEYYSLKEYTGFGISDERGTQDFFESHILDEYLEAFKADPNAFEWEFCLSS
ncbi:hypothetical protein [Ruminococcus sp.]|uniref:hypothetical protein n=1 Tax=Ruminococcus sp. TaxID=41978 RepID=UPI0025D21B47|nr:hypothetical protein [Ruminococcus sp.]MBQ8966555.1 hypothetical protein [Ruminococcus sp.]